MTSNYLYHTLKYLRRLEWQGSVSLNTKITYGAGVLSIEFFTSIVLSSIFFLKQNLMIFVFCFLMNCLIKTSSDCYYSFYLLITFMHFPSFSFFSFVWHFYYFFILILFFPLFISCFLSLNLLIKKLKNYKKLNFVFFIFL